MQMLSHFLKFMILVPRSQVVQELLRSLAGDRVAKRTAPGPIGLQWNRAGAPDYRQPFIFSAAS
jgi:hypothetical protein